MVWTHSAKSKFRPLSDEELASKLSNEPLAVIEHGQKVQQYLCHCLEAIADGLPDNLDQVLVGTTLPLLKQELGNCIRDHEDALYPLLEVRALPDDCVRELLPAVKEGNARDLSYASDIAEQLEHLARGGKPENPDMLGYMLRGFFETRRRHNAWENAVIVPLARKRLTAEDQKALAARMLQHRGQHL